MHVVRLVRVRRDQRVEAGLGAVVWIARRTHRDAAAVVLGQVIEEIARGEQRLDVVFECIVGDRAFGRVGDRAAELLLRNDLVGHRLDHVRSGDEHVGRVLHHEDEVGHRGRVNRPARARPHNQADLRYDTRCEYVTLEDLGIAAERRHAFLDARAAAVVEADDGRADLHRIVHDLHDLFGVPLRKRAAEDGEVLAEDIDEAAVDRAAAGDDTVARHYLVLHSEIGAIMLDIGVEFFERALVEKHVKPFARGQLALGVLRVDALLPAPKSGGGAAAFHFGDIGGHRLLRQNGKASSARASAIMQM